MNHKKRLLRSTLESEPALEEHGHRDLLSHVFPVSGCVGVFIGSDAVGFRAGLYHIMIS